VLAGQRVKLLVKDDGDQYFQITRGRGFDFSGLVERVRSRVGGLRRTATTGSAAPAAEPDEAEEPGT
jgi:glucose-6-phosphate-specific signal transduction histidine kinase